ncbi:MAG TPA: DedA family protein [Candidatus Dormibacteraeota bacterium]|nr:DedA family protein [Candidatus Dormibacteraeota bacterium]
MHLLTALTQFFIGLIHSVGLPGIYLAMFLGNSGVPIGSEIIMPAGGAFLAGGHVTGAVLVGIVGSLGELTGALFLYAVGYYGGRPFVQRYGRYFLIRDDDLHKADVWFQKYGDRTVFICRLLPVVRAIAALPAGITRMRLPVFVGYTLSGSLIWCVSWAYAGMTLGAHWDAFGPIAHRFSGLIVAALVLLAAVGLWMHLPRKGKGTS